ncbi:FAD-dependent oxidoreductase [Micromonospora arborensis]|uniref:FAD-dependent oxidoreductase n=1 Tax=Micromonospora arborensis TaxID=2116518 RepID=A0A318NL24_9ACTN|nr:tryptophan 7-halogenase [Micromonospora arborensis]PYC71598.1 FAD-dependent oxidoreductase [Micromonospora arborensis]
MKKYDHDVVILGAGIAGSILGAVLARNGADVLVIDAGSHPKFAIGESMIPYTLLTLQAIADRYDVPEVKTLSNFKACTRDINPSFGWKKHFGFLHHRPGEEPDHWEANQFNTPGVLHTSSHLFRQDTDAHMFHVAVRYGCQAKLGYRVEDVELDEDVVVVRGADGAEIRARYLVDASGFRSPLADKLDLRDQPCRFKHHSRSIFTHMIGVKHTDEVLRHSADQRPPVPWHHGTMHHLFERGWFWVIPFNNNPYSRNPLCSVGLTMDNRLYPKPDGVSPGEEFYQFAARFPAVARQFADARPVREWVGTGRLQYSSRNSIGHRWCLMSHAAGFLDPLFSRGLSNTAEVINALAWRLLAALEDDDFSVQRFAYVEKLEQGLLDFNDKLVNSAFTAFDTYPLWNAVFRIWAFGSVIGGFRVQRALAKYRTTGDVKHLTALEDPPNVGLWWPDHDGYRKLFDAMVEGCSAYEKGLTSADDVARELFSRMRDADFVPPGVGFADENRPYLKPSPRVLAKVLRWAAREAPPEQKEMVIGTARDMLKSATRGRRLF